ncbi:MAG: hypothetical protein FWG98_15675, partial [Candidatus Cloacimonetes bacterium]|nr:hypothetical protein [Candidatus Cloacimonadota bacterium]
MNKLIITSFFLIMCIFSVLLSTPIHALMSDVWILDSGNPNNNQNDWTSLWWLFSNINHQIPIPSPFYAFEMGIDSEGFVKDIASDFSGWHLLTAYLGNSIEAIDELSGDHAFPMVVLYNQDKAIIRFVFIYLLYLSNPNNLPDYLVELYENYFPNDFSHMIRINIFPFTDTYVNIAEPIDVILVINANSNTGLLSSFGQNQDSIFALDQVNNNILESNTFSKKINGKSMFYYADFKVAYDDVTQHHNNTLSFSKHVTLNAFNRFRPKGTTWNSEWTLPVRPRHTIVQPGAIPIPSENIILPMYNLPLGVVQMRNSPILEKRRVLAYPAYDSFRLSTLPSEFVVNSYSEMISEPQNVQIAYDFTLRILDSDLPFFNLYLRDYLDFVTKYKTTPEPNNRSLHHFYTHFLDYEDAQNISLRFPYAYLVDINVKVKAMFDKEDPSKECFVYIEDYRSIISDLGNGDYFPLLPVQRIQTFFEDTVFTNQTFTISTHVIVDFNAEVTLDSCVLNPNNGSDNIFYGFTINSGKLIVNGGIFNLGSAKLFADGAHSEIHLNGIQNTVYMKNIHISNGAKLFINGTNVDMTDGSITISGNNSSLYVVNSSSVTLSGINSALTLSGLSAITISTNSHLNLLNNSTLIMNDSSNMTLNNGQLSFHDSMLNMRHDYEYFDFTGRIGILMNNNSTLTANNSNLYVSNRSDIISTNSEINILNNSS